MAKEEAVVRNSVGLHFNVVLIVEGVPVLALSQTLSIGLVPL